ncbi:uncharacterized protein LOC131889069 isoform X1 [Tigriopus californicus]|uniref:uncharacterized protein LOC131889069 isoform X1 n=1 Tax=Tigriopus californicus TaxID=6832 RepID=UPI0027DA93D8|nr:uncharacterized protein LOC131889069 isoform X1 [Tigriopus californicus]|eukprot:TCALIF_02630-PA protein Name:"Protein of unknown function" AED:0.26 eAED:0.26 QI:181/1/1/1/0/0.5/2/112/144
MSVRGSLFALCLVLGLGSTWAKDNVLGTELEICSIDPMTGWHRGGYCRTDDNDFGTHTMCSVMTAEFLEYTKAQGNDLSNPAPQYNFPGLKPGDKWCICALRWREAFKAGKAPKVVLESSDEKTLQYNTLDEIQSNNAAKTSGP